MAGISLKSDAALRAEDKRLLTRDWIDSNARKSKHPRSGPSWDHPKDLTKSKSRTLKTNDCEDDGENAGVKTDGKESVCNKSISRRRDERCTHEVFPDETEDGTVDEIKTLQEKNKGMEQILGSIGNEVYDQDIVERLKEGESYRSITEKLGTSCSRDVEDTNGRDLIEDVEGDGDELGFVERLFRTCLHLFEEIWLELSALSPSPRCTRDGYLVEGLGKFYLWGESFKEGTLDNALEQSEELREDVLKLICRIGSILTRRLFPMVVAPLRRKKLDEAIQCLSLFSDKAGAIVSGSTSEADSDSEDSEDEPDGPDGGHKSEDTIGRDIRFLTACLMELVPTLEQSLPRVGKPARSAFLTPPPAFRVSEPASTYVRNIFDKFPQADIELIERLGEANWQRHVKVRNRIDQVANDDLVESKAFVVTPFSEFRDSALGSSIPTRSQYAASAASHTSFVSSHADGEERSIRVPPTPAEVSTGKPFQCNICGQTLHKIRSRVDWKIHVFADLQPYICTFSTCKDALVQFPNRKMWLDHEFDEHRVHKSWVCPDCSAESFSPDAWDEHLRQDHDVIFAGPQHSIALGSAQKVVSKPIDKQECPMCKVIPGTTRRAFSTHVGRHMEQIALAVLPRETEDDLEGSSVATDLPIHDQRKGSNAGSDVAPSVNSSGGPLEIHEVSAFDPPKTDPSVEIIAFTGDQQRASPPTSVLAPGSSKNPLRVRTWTDRSGTYIADAEWIGFTKDDQLNLRKVNGVEIAVPMVKLAVEDLKYVEQTSGVSLDWKIGASDQTGSLAGHTHERLWKCDQCPKNFRRWYNLRKHKQCHADADAISFPCDQCPQSFRRQDTLRVHKENNHVNVFRCERCDERFGRNDVLMMHTLQEHPEDTIKCICANEEDDGNTVLCEGCDTWQHIKCYYSSSGKVPDVHNCTDCVPRAIQTKNTIEQIPLSREVKASYTRIIDSILAASDLNTISENRIRKGIQETVGYDVTHQKVAIKELIFERFGRIRVEKNITPKAVDKDKTVTKMNLAGTKPRDVVPRNSTSLGPVTKPTLNGEEHRNASEMENRPRLDRTISDGYGDSLYTPGNELSSTAGKQDYPLPYSAVFSTRLDRIISDGYGESLYTPGYELSSTAGKQDCPLPYSAVFSERLETANKSHLSARALSPPDHYADARPPFRRGSEYYPASPTSTEERKSISGKDIARILAQHQHDDGVTPAVISPRDTYIEPDVSLVAEWPQLQQRLQQQQQQQTQQAQQQIPTGAQPHPYFNPQQTQMLQQHQNHIFQRLIVQAQNQFGTQVPPDVIQELRQKSVRIMTELMVNQQRQLQQQRSQQQQQQTLMTQLTENER